MSLLWDKNRLSCRANIALQVRTKLDFDFLLGFRHDLSARLMICFLKTNKKMMGPQPAHIVDGGTDLIANEREEYFARIKWAEDMAAQFAEVFSTGKVGSILPTVTPSF